MCPSHLETPTGPSWYWVRAIHPAVPCSAGILSDSFVPIELPHQKTWSCSFSIQTRRLCLPLTPVAPTVPRVEKALCNSQTQAYRLTDNVNGLRPDRPRLLTALSSTVHVRLLFHQTFLLRLSMSTANNIPFLSTFDMLASLLSAVNESSIRSVLLFKGCGVSIASKPIAFRWQKQGCR